jgi:hypothetical protein
MPDASIRSNPLMKVKSKSSLQPLPLAAYLTGAVGSTFLISAPQAEAAVTSVTFGFGSVLSASDNFTNYTTPTSPNYGTIFARGETRPGFGNRPPFNIPSYTVGLGMQSFANQGTFYHQGSGGLGSAAFLANGTIIGGGGNGNVGTAYFFENRTSYQITTDQPNQEHRLPDYHRQLGLGQCELECVSESSDHPLRLRRVCAKQYHHRR